MEYKLTRTCDQNNRVAWKIEKTNGEHFTPKDLVYFDRAWIDNEASKLKVGESKILTV